MTVCPLLHRSRPCGECPFRKDVPPGQFPASRYRALRATAGSPGREAPMNAPVFACHMTQEGKEVTCAGWLAVAGYFHLLVRLAVVQRRLDPAALEPQPGWPELYGSYDEMATAQAGEDE